MWSDGEEDAVAYLHKAGLEPDQARFMVHCLKLTKFYFRCLQHTSALYFRAKQQCITTLFACAVQLHPVVGANSAVAGSQLACLLDVSRM